MNCKPEIDEALNSNQLSTLNSKLSTLNSQLPIEVFVSRELRKTNIAEYLLYMWQVEDILRACDCSLTRLRREYISRFDYTDEQKDELTDWYGSLIRMMNDEGCRLKGHLQINRNVMQQLEQCHKRLLDDDSLTDYKAEYYRVLPYIVELRKKQTEPAPEIETCFNALYGTLILRLQNKTISTGTRHAIEQITTFIGKHLVPHAQSLMEKP